MKNGLIICVLFINLFSFKIGISQETPPFKGAQFPLSNYYYPGNCLDWGGLNPNFTGKHVADDFCVNEGTNVYAPLAGIIKFAQAKGTCQDNWVYLTVLESRTLDGSIKSIILGHVHPTVQEGATIKKGEKIGTITSYYPCSSDHIHYGVLNAAYKTTGIYNNAIKGYLPETIWPGDYLNPIKFTLGQIFDYHFQITGNTSFYGEILNPEREYSGIHWYTPFTTSNDRNLYIRDYQNTNCGGGYYGRAAIVFDALHGARQAYGIRCEFFNYWTSRDGPDSELGVPVSDEYVLKNSLPLIF